MIGYINIILQFILLDRHGIIAVIYNGFSRGDKCRIGRGISVIYNQELLPELERGKKKGSTNTYFV